MKANMVDATQPVIYDGQTLLPNILIIFTATSFFYVGLAQYRTE